MSEDRNFGGLICHVYGTTKAKRLFIFLHGDRRMTTGTEWAAAMVTACSATPVCAVALIRPGYDDVNNVRPQPQIKGWPIDQYTRPNILRIGQAIQEMKQAWSPTLTIGVGYSGGSACLGVLLGLVPGAIQHAVLVSGPLDVRRWRRLRMLELPEAVPYPNSLSSMDFVDQIPKGTRIRCIHGADDTRVQPFLSESYVAMAHSKGINATYQAVAGAAHDDPQSIRMLGNAAIKAARAF